MAMVLGLKLSHDAGLALIEDGKLKLSIEIEKTDNAPRYSKFPADVWGTVQKHLRQEGFLIHDLDAIVVDGWEGGKFKNHTRWNVAGYMEFEGGAMNSPTLGMPIQLPGLYRGRPNLDDIEGFSFFHMTGHMLGGYAMSPYSADKTPVGILAWDGQVPRLYICDPNSPTPLKLHAWGFSFSAQIYGNMGLYFGPYRQEWIRKSKQNPMLQGEHFGGYGMSGKLMGYIGHGTPNEDYIERLSFIYRYTNTNQTAAGRIGVDVANLRFAEHEFCRGALVEAEKLGISDADALASIHEYLQRIICALAASLPAGMPLLHVGGPGLNIKWNSALRKTRPVFVPPCPNDSGSAIGAACAYNAIMHGQWSLEWNMYAGHHIGRGHRMRPGWHARVVTPQEIAELLDKEPFSIVVAMNGRTEIGPRALGNRSMIANPRNLHIKWILNQVKGREQWRPVAPICLEEDAPSYFEPGTPDPYMLFDHVATDLAKERARAIVHLDGTARLQTVSRDSNPELYALLVAFKERTGVPVLCNTSANFQGTGFFPDIDSAQQWCEQHAGPLYIWTESRLLSYKPE